jgi:hypothetical protein
MKKQAIILSIWCVAAAGIFAALGETAAEDGRELARRQKEAMLGKSGSKPPVEEEAPRPIDIASLQEINPASIATMQIYRLEWIELKPVKKYLSIPFGDDSREEVNALMGLIKQAPKAGPPGERELMGDPDRALVIRLVEGPAVEILYSSHLREPFAGVESRKLKEALYALSCNSNSLAIMQVRSDKTIDVKHTRAQSVQRSGVTSSGRVTLALRLGAEGDLVLSLKVTDESRVRIFVDGQKPIQYGGAVVFDTLDGDDMFIAYLLQPVFQ